MFKVNNKVIDVVLVSLMLTLSRYMPAELLHNLPEFVIIRNIFWNELFKGNHKVNNEGEDARSW